LSFDVGFFYSGPAGVGREFGRYAQLGATRVLASTNDPASFYDAAGRLKPQYAENMERLREWASDWLVLVQSSRCLQQRIDHPNQAGVSCRPDYDGGIRISAPSRSG